MITPCLKGKTYVENRIRFTNMKGVHVMSSQIDNESFNQIGDKHIQYEATELRIYIYIYI
jgi:hypothetical protein